MKRFFSAFFAALFLWSAATVPAEENYPDPRCVFRWDRDERLLGFKSVEKIALTHTVEAGGKVRPLSPAASEKGHRLATSAANVTGRGCGYHWWVLGDDIFAANGIFGQLIVIDPRTESVAVILSAWDKPLSRDDDNRRFSYLFTLRSLALAVEDTR